MPAGRADKVAGIDNEEEEEYCKNEKRAKTEAGEQAHTTASFYKCFSPEEAFRLSQKLEIHYTPKHGSWLDIAEIELSALSLQCLENKRIPTISALNDILKSWSTNRNSLQKGVLWHFSTAEARIKLKHLYPIIQM